MRRLAAAFGLFALAITAVAVAGEPPLQALARTTVDAEQGVYAIAADGTVLVAQAAERAVHPASVTKIATSLALLERLGPAHRFATSIAARGPIRDGRLDGDLVVVGGGDPFLVDESAVLLAKRLRARGVRVVAGRLVARGPLLFDWQPDGDGRALGAVLEGNGAALRAARAQVDAHANDADGSASAPRGDDAPLVFLRQPSPAATEEPLAVVHSPPLLHVVKALNCYSNNVFHLAADAIGGADAVARSARMHLPEQLRGEVVIANGAGAGTENRLSPRAAVALLGALRAELARSGADLSAALPVSGIDPGTLQDRLPEHRGFVVGKTGTSGSVGASALTGALSSGRYGVVLFAVLNHDVPVAQARARQDAFVRALIAAVEARPWPYADAAGSPVLETRID